MYVIKGNESGSYISASPLTIFSGIGYYNIRGTAVFNTEADAKLYLRYLCITNGDQPSEYTIVKYCHVVRAGDFLVDGDGDLYILASLSPHGYAAVCILSEYYGGYIGDSHFSTKDTAAEAVAGLAFCPYDSIFDCIKFAQAGTPELFERFKL